MEITKAQVEIISIAFVICKKCQGQAYRRDSATSWSI